MSDDIRTELAAMRDAAERYRAEATALHARQLDRLAELEAKLAAQARADTLAAIAALTPPPKPSG